MPGINYAGCYYRFTVDQYQRMIEAGILGADDRVELLEGNVVYKFPSVAPPPPGRALPVTAIDHVTVLITDVPRSRHFYGELLGLREIAPPRAFDFVAVWYDLGGTYLHLLLKPQADPISARHFCLRVYDIHEARRVVQSAGLAMDETVKIPSAARFFVRDPDGNRIEILEWERPYDPVADGAFRV